MDQFKTNEFNNFHYVTTVTYKRLPIFRGVKTCEIFIEVLKEIREIHPFKLIGYVIMPDHIHLILNPLEEKIGAIMRKLKGKTAHLIVNWLKENNFTESLNKLLIIGKNERQTHAVWQRDFSAIDLWSPKFLRQKLDYIHLNPLRAEFCDHPAKWKFSSYHAYLPHKAVKCRLKLIGVHIGMKKKKNNYKKRTRRLATGFARNDNL